MPGAGCTPANPCDLGVVACRRGRARCTDSGHLDPTADGASCGPPGAGEVCTSGSCGCPVGETLCGSACARAPIDDANCGCSGTACGSGTACLGGVSTTPAAPPAASWGMGCASVPGGPIDCMGGEFSGAQAWNQRFDPTTNLWSDGSPLGFGTAFAPNAAAADGRVYLVADQSDPAVPRVAGDVDAFSPGADAWSYGLALGGPTAGLNEPRTAFASATGLDGRIYVFGGFDGAGRPLSSVEVYDPAVNRWTLLGAASAQIPTPRGYAAAATAPSGTIYLLGGSASATFPPSAAAALATVEAFDPASQSWSAGLHAMPAPRALLGAALGSDGRLYVAGNAAADATTAAYDPAADGWTATAKLNAPRAGPAVVADLAGRIYVVGGLDVGTVELYRPGFDVWVQ